MRCHFNPDRIMRTNISLKKAKNMCKSSDRQLKVTIPLGFPILEKAF